LGPFRPTKKKTKKQKTPKTQQQNPPFFVGFLWPPKMFCSPFCPTLHMVHGWFFFFLGSGGVGGWGGVKKVFGGGRGWGVERARAFQGWGLKNTNKKSFFFFFFGLPPPLHPQKLSFFFFAMGKFGGLAKGFKTTRRDFFLFPPLKVLCLTLLPPCLTTGGVFFGETNLFFFSPLPNPPNFPTFSFFLGKGEKPTSAVEQSDLKNGNKVSPSFFFFFLRVFVASGSVRGVGLVLPRGWVGGGRGVIFFAPPGSFFFWALFLVGGVTDFAKPFFSVGEVWDRWGGSATGPFFLGIRLFEHPKKVFFFSFFWWGW